MEKIARLSALFIGLAAMLGVAANLNAAAELQPEPFSTVPPPNATFSSPILPAATAEPAFAPLDGRPDYDFVDRLRETSGYLAGGVVGIAVGGAAYWLAHRADRTSGLPISGGVDGVRLAAGRFAYGPRLRRITWLAPSAAGLALLVVAGSKCVPSTVCYANAGGVQIVVPCDEAESQAEAELAPTATPRIDCPDPSRGGTNAYEAARAGGKHSPYLALARGLPDSSLRSAFRSFEANVAEHLGKIADPTAQTLRTPWEQMDPREQQGLLRGWCAEVSLNRELADVILGVMTERGLVP